MKRIAIYCGSNKGVRPEYTAAAQELGALLAREKIELVYGGGCVGLMGVVADAALAGGAEVIGVLSHVLKGRELEHQGLTRLEFVPSMHERKARMHELADVLLTLPGGYGTLDELQWQCR